MAARGGGLKFCSAREDAFAGKPALQGNRVRLEEIGWLSGRLREQAPTGGQ